MSSLVQAIEAHLKYLNQSIEYAEKELEGRRAYRERLNGQLNRARRLEREELQNAKS